jgi:4a-hydroxytetrahydrobiopterin dehydratase
MTEHIFDLISKRCIPCEGGTKPLNDEKVRCYLDDLPGWVSDENTIFKKFEFKNYYQTIFFVNAVAWIAHRENHHPEMEVSYRACKIRYSTHAIDGLSENDFICAAKVEALNSGINLSGCNSTNLV